MTDRITEALKYTLTHRDRFLDELISFSTIPSISTDPDRENEVKNGSRLGSKETNFFRH